LLWPEKRLNKDSIWRTQDDCSLHLRKEFVPWQLHVLRRLADNDGYIKVGMIPKGTPINLVANLDPDSDHKVVFVKAAEKLINLKLRTFHGTRPLPNSTNSFRIWSQRINVPTSSKTKDTISALTSRIQTSAR
jgi:hypothetical protein